MSEIVDFTSLTLHGVMQAPGRPDEDRRGGFKHGGWATPYADEVSGKLAGEGTATTGSLLLGRRTYEDILRRASTVWKSIARRQPLDARSQPRRAR